MKKGDCFDAAYRELQQMEDEEEANITLCHGIVMNPNGMFVHAWVEKVADNGTTIVIDVSNGGDIRMFRDSYYQGLNVRGVVRYTPDEAIMLCLKNRHAGPWDLSFDHLIIE